MAGGERHLDPGRPAAGPRLELPLQGREVGGVDGRVAVFAHDVPDRRQPLPVEERQRGYVEKGPALVPERAGGQRPAEERPEPHQVPAHRRLDHQGGEDGEQVERRADPDLALAGRRGQEEEGADRQRHDERRHAERLVALTREGDGNRQPRNDHPAGDPEGRPSRAVGQPPGRGGQQQEGAGDRAGEDRRGGQQRGPGVSPLRPEQEGAERRGQARGEGELAGEQDGKERQRKPPRGQPAGSSLPVAAGQAGEAPGGDDRGGGRNDLRPQRRAQDRDQDAVAGKGVAREPAELPDAGPVVPHQPGAVEVGGKVGGCRPDHQPGDGAERREHPRRRARQPLHRGQAAARPARKPATVPTRSGRSSHGQWPASSRWSTSAGPPRASA